MIKGFPGVKRPVVGVLAGILLCCIVISLHSRPGSVVLRVDSIPHQNQLKQLEQIIKAQKKTIDLYAKRPKVVFRCKTDEARNKYPKHASDNYTTITMGTSDECGAAGELDAVVMVHSSAPNFEHRERYRAVYSNYTATKPYKLKVVFLVGQVTNANLQINLEMENRQFGDTIQGNFLDTYKNLTLKAVAGFRWVHETCKNYKLLIKMDDDVVFDVHRFFGEYWSSTGKSLNKRRLSCEVWKNAHVNRGGKWRVEYGVYSDNKYRFPYCSGFFVTISPDLVSKMYEHGKKLPFLWVDDAYMYGMVPHSIGNVRFKQLSKRKGGEHITPHQYVYNLCKQKLASNCKIFAVVTTNAQTFYAVYKRFSEQGLKNTSLNATLAPTAAANKPKDKKNVTGESGPQKTGDQNDKQKEVLSGITKMNTETITDKIKLQTGSIENSKQKTVLQQPHPKSSSLS